MVLACRICDWHPVQAPVGLEPLSPESPGQLTDMLPATLPWEPFGARSPPAERLLFATVLFNSAVFGCFVMQYRVKSRCEAAVPKATDNQRVGARIDAQRPDLFCRRVDLETTVQPLAYKGIK